MNAIIPQRETDLIHDVGRKIYDLLVGLNDELGMMGQCVHSIEMTPSDPGVRIYLMQRHTPHGGL